MGGGSEEVQLDGLRVAFERVGDGPPLVLLHGVLGDSRDWRPQLEALSDGFTVVAWDAPGCGRSSDPPGSFRLPDYADTLAAFIEALGLARPHVLGLSFGGGLALELYRRHPAMPRTLVLASAYAGWAGSLPPEVVEERLERAIREAELPPDRFLSRWQSELLTDAASPELGAELMAIMSDYHPGGYLTMAYAFAEADLRDVLPQIDVPTLLLYGDEDPRSPLSVARDLHAQIPGSKLVVMRGVGHMSNMEAPDRFTAEVRSFLASDTAPGNADLLRPIYAEWGRGNWRPHFEVYHPQMEWGWSDEFPGLAGVFEDHRDPNPRLRTWLSGWEHWRAEADEYLEVGDHVVVLATYHGRGRGSGVEIEQEGAHVFQLRDRKVVRLEIFATREKAIESVHAARAEDRDRVG